MAPTMKIPIEPKRRYRRSFLPPERVDSATSAVSIEAGDMGDPGAILLLPAQDGLELPGQEGPAQMIRRTTDQRRSAKVKRKAAGTTITATVTNLTAAGKGASASAYCSATTIGRWKR